MNKSQEFKEVYKTFNPADIAFIKSLLENNDVVYYINNENANLIGNITFAEPMRVMVEAGHFESAQELLKDFTGHYTKFVGAEELEEDDEDETSL